MSRDHEAAELLQRRAKGATDAGYGWHLTDLPGANEVWAARDAAGWDAFMVATTATRLNPNPGGTGHADAAYIAMMHPGVAQALAAMLRGDESARERLVDLILGNDR